MRRDCDFTSHGTKCGAWFYDSASGGRSPCVVMGHGFSAVRDQRLDAYADRFAQARLTVLLFDYRHFGASEGEPRQLVSIHRQLQDWEAAIAKARSMPSVDPTRIALFGSSFSGGHVQAMAVRDLEVAAAVAQVPFCDGLRNLPALGVAHVMRLIWAGLRDATQALLGFGPYRIPAVGGPGTMAAMATPDAVPGFANMTQPNSTWRNEVCARIALTIGAYRPGASTHKIRCPILYSIAEKDLLTPARFAHEAAHLAPKGEVKSYNCGHFDVYVPPLWETVVSDQTDFLVRHLKPH